MKTLNGLNIQMKNTFVNIGLSQILVIIFLHLEIMFSNETFLVVVLFQPVIWLNKGVNDITQNITERWCSHLYLYIKFQMPSWFDKKHTGKCIKAYSIYSTTL